MIRLLFVGALTTVLLAMPLASPADDYSVLGAAGSSYLWNNLRAELATLDNQRDQAQADAVTSPAALAARQAQIQQDLVSMVGHLPDEITPLNAQVTGTIIVPGENYKIEKIVYESRPGFHVTANLYLPTDVTEPVPGVLIPCGHSAEGKAYDSYQRASILMAKNGMAALIFDPISQGERLQIFDTYDGTTAHTLVGTGARALGMTAGTYEIWDAMRGIDYLISRPEINGDLIGMTGNSGGGTQTLWTTAFDTRIKVSAPSCYVSEFDRVVNAIGPQDCEQHYPNQGKYLIDHADLITLRAPTPIRILAAEQDYFPIAGTQQAYADAQQAYGVLGATSSVDLFTYDDPHGWSQPRREAAVQWMKTWLLGDSSPVVEPANLQVQSISALQCTTTGQVRSSFSDEKTVPDLNLEYAIETKSQRAAFWAQNDAETCRTEIRELLGIDSSVGSINKVQAGIIDRDGYQIEKLGLTRPNEIPIPGLLFTPDNLQGTAPVTIYIDGSGKAAGADVGGPVEQLVNQGQIVLSIDLCGFGETKDTDSKYQNDEFRTSMVAMYNGRPLVGRRVEEIMASLEWLLQRPDVDASNVNVIGVGDAVTSVVHAGALDTRVTHVELVDPTITSWLHDVVAQPLRENMLGHVVPGALEKYDLADLQQIMPNSVFPDPPVRERSVLHWRFDGNLASESGQYAGVAIGNAVAGTSNGAFPGSGAVTFDGANDAVRINKDVLGEGPFAIVFWSKTHPDDNQGYFLSDSVDYGNLFMRRYNANGNSVFTGWISEIQLGELGPDGTSGTSWPDNTWHQHVLTVDEYGRHFWYVNGELLTSGYGLDFEGLTSDLFLGNRANMDRDFKGWLDDLQIYNWSVFADDAEYLFTHPGDTLLDRLSGDANQDGVVNAADARALAANWLKGNATWTKGDFNGDGVVDDLDASILAAHWNMTAEGQNLTVPEPTLLPLLLLGSLSALLLWRRRSP
ncbi:MAG: acetylxylan esterase [Pirellulales bacterium]|nr:acetylxylan esterase [Pirellulales bacterium]